MKRIIIIFFIINGLSCFPQDIDNGSQTNENNLKIVFLNAKVNEINNQLVILKEELTTLDKNIDNSTDEKIFLVDWISKYSENFKNSLMSSFFKIMDIKNIMFIIFIPFIIAYRIDCYSYIEKIESKEKQKNILFEKLKEISFLLKTRLFYLFSFGLLGNIILQITTSIAKINPNFLTLIKDSSFKISSFTLGIGFLLYLFYAVNLFFKRYKIEEIFYDVEKVLLYLCNIQIFLIFLNIKTLGEISSKDFIKLTIIPIIILYISCIGVIFFFKKDGKENHEDREIFLSREYILDSLKKLLKEKNSSSLILIEGDWGIGKTFFIKNGLQNKDLIMIDSMLFSDGKNLMKATLKKLECYLSNKKIKRSKVKVIEKYTELICNNLPLNLSNVKNRIGCNENIENFKEDIEKLLKNHKLRPIIAIDNMERILDKDYLINVIGFLHELHTIGHIDVLVLSEYKKLEKILKVPNYLEKFFHHKFKLFGIQNVEIIEYFLKKYEKKNKLDTEIIIKNISPLEDKVNEFEKEVKNLEKESKIEFSIRAKNEFNNLVNNLKMSLKNPRIIEKFFIEFDNHIKNQKIFVFKNLEKEFELLYLIFLVKTLNIKQNKNLEDFLGGITLNALKIIKNNTVPTKFGIEETQKIFIYEILNWEILKPKEKKFIHYYYDELKYHDYSIICKTFNTLKEKENLEKKEINDSFDILDKIYIYSLNIKEEEIFLFYKKIVNQLNSNDLTKEALKIINDKTSIMRLDFQLKETMDLSILDKIIHSDLNLTKDLNNIHKTMIKAFNSTIQSFNTFYKLEKNFKKSLSFSMREKDISIENCYEEIKTFLSIEKEKDYFVISSNFLELFGTTIFEENLKSKFKILFEYFRVIENIKRKKNLNSNEETPGELISKYNEKLKKIKSSKVQNDSRNQFYTINNIKNKIFEIVEKKNKNFCLRIRETWEKNKNKNKDIEKIFLEVILFIKKDNMLLYTSNSDIWFDLKFCYISFVFYLNQSRIIEFEELFFTTDVNSLKIYLKSSEMDIKKLIRYLSNSEFYFQTEENQEKIYNVLKKNENELSNSILLGIIKKFEEKMKKKAFERIFPKKMQEERFKLDL